jgi:photosystem II stability/assembly factor-like uncharacterized protein
MNRTVYRLCRVVVCTAVFDAVSGCAFAPDEDTGGSEGDGGGDINAHEALVAAVRATNWSPLAAAPTARGGAKQDDVFFIDDAVGYVANGPGGAVEKTTDGGETWTSVLESRTAYFRAVAFFDANHGFVGNLGAGLVGSISDPSLLYETKDAGATWQPVTAINGDATSVRGICNLHIIDSTHIVAVGRANGPAAMLSSSDAGASWTARDLSDDFSMVIDAHFFSPEVGLLAGMDPDGNACRIMRTEDGGETRTEVFASFKDSNLCWQLNFPSPTVGYAAVQDAASGPGTFAKTIDAGHTWIELELPPLATENAPYPGIGIGFLDDKIGWLAPENSTLPVYRTFDGGESWEQDPVLTGPINRFRVVNDHVAYASGARVWKLSL